ncbi:MAG: DNA mismatch repair protein MutS, partial [Alphaproteobacteria bacterium]
MNMPTAKKETSKPTPMMVQYLAVKDIYRDVLLFYRMGDFYEMFFQDAETAAQVLGITLTHRGTLNGDPVPMCGVPVHAMDGYLARLIQQGYKVAICEQTETPETFKARGGKGPLPRGVVRVITPGTLQEDGLLVSHQHNYLAALGRSAGEFAIAWADMSTGSFNVQACDEADIEALLSRLGVAEFLYPEEMRASLEMVAAPFNPAIRPAQDFDSRRSEAMLLSLYEVSTLDSLGAFSRAMLSAAGGLLTYLRQTQIESMPRLSRLSVLSQNAFMEIDAATRRSLELTQTLTESRSGSLLHAIDKTKTAAGARLLATRLSAPLTDRSLIEGRLDLVSWFLRNQTTGTDIISALNGLPDIERSLSRLASVRGGPRDLLAIARAVSLGRDISVRLSAQVSEAQGIDEHAPDIMMLTEDTQCAADLADSLMPALADDMPLLARDGNFIRAGYDSSLDQIRQLRDESRRLIAGLQADYAAQTDISSLKIKHNNVLGYHIEVRSLHGDKLMSDNQFIHRQTTAQAVRFTTTELADMEKQMASASDRALAVELALFETLVKQVLARSPALEQTAAALAALDVATASAQLASSRYYCRPVMIDDTRFTIIGGRHPVVERALADSTPFIANDCRLEKGSHLWLLTGPNMAGKSTFLRQNAHIAIMAQAGLFVPADNAEIGIIDRLFSRVGASDDLARGRSTFMVEMVETATILNQSTSRSLVILDEIGRGTATWDGLSIAWA